MPGCSLPRWSGPAHLQSGNRFVIEAGQRLVPHHVETVDGAVRHVSMPFRSTWPAELDLMAPLAGMTLPERWGGWRGEPFTSASRSHVSIWERGD